MRIYYYFKGYISKKRYYPFGSVFDRICTKNNTVAEKSAEYCISAVSYRLSLLGTLKLA